MRPEPRALSVTLRHRVGDVTLDLAFEAPPGITVLFGPSGAGKTTILNAVAGLTAPDSGVVRLGEATWLDTARGVSVPAHERRLAFVFQSPALFPHMTALSNVMYGMDRRAPRAELRARARELLAEWDVSALADRRPAGFSGGEAQRVALARAMARAPDAILMDEPFSALDDARRRALAVRVKDAVRSLGVPALFVTHSAREAEALGDRLVVLSAGKIAREGTPREALDEGAAPSTPE